jgi:F-type H+-transporting ATPase subunit b
MMTMRTALCASAFAFAATAANAEGAGMPQLDPTWFGNQLFWLAISFALLFVLVSRFVVPSVSGVLASRANAIDGAIREAERAKLEAESTRGSANSENQSARARAAELMAQAQAENSRDAAEALAKLDHDLAKRASHAAAVLEDAVAKAASNIDLSAQSLATTMTETLLGKASSSDANAPKLKLAVKR